MMMCVGGGVAQLVERRDLGSIPDAVARRCVLEKDT